MEQIMEYTPEQLAGAEKMASYISKIQNQEHQNFIIAIGTAFMNGIEYGVALEKDNSRFCSN